MFAKVAVISAAVAAAHAGVAAPVFGGYGHGGYGVAAAPAAVAYPAVGHGYHAAAAPLAYAAAAPVAKVAAVAAPVVAKAAVVYPPQPYQFGYESVDEYGTKQSRHEVSDAHNNKKGSYSFTDAHGISRRVDYVADKLGFRATVHTNEPGTAPSAPAGVLYNAAPVKTVHAVKAVAPVAVKAAAAVPVAHYAHTPYAYGHH